MAGGNQLHLGSIIMAESSESEGQYSIWAEIKLSQLNERYYWPEMYKQVLLCKFAIIIIGKKCMDVPVYIMDV